MVNGKEKLSKEWKKVVAQIVQEHPDWKASQIRRQVIVHLGEDKTPGLSSIQKELTPMRMRYQQIQESGMESPWHLGLMSRPEYNISPEAVPYILMTQSWAEKNPEPLFKQPHGCLSTRQALWIARLHAIVGISQIKTKDIPKIASFLWRWSEAYALREVICELSGVLFDTSELDNAIRKGATPVIVGKTILTFYPEGRFAIDTADKKLLEQMEQMEKEGE